MKRIGAFTITTIVALSIFLIYSAIYQIKRKTNAPNEPSSFEFIENPSEESLQEITKLSKQGEEGYNKLIMILKQCQKYSPASVNAIIVSGLVVDAIYDIEIENNTDKKIYTIEEYVLKNSLKWASVAETRDRIQDILHHREKQNGQK